MLTKIELKNKAKQEYSIIYSKKQSDVYLQFQSHYIVLVSPICYFV